MVKILMRRIPSKMSKETQHKVIKSLSSAMLETYTPTRNIEIVSSKVIIQKSNNVLIKEDK